MFEGWATEYLASYLGHFCDLQKEQLRISLWRAWRTGVSLENVSLRADAFDYFQLPLKLLSGRVGRVQAQVPWHALRSAPVVIELSEVHLCLSLLDDEDLQPGPAGERAWAAKQAELAVAELQELSAAANGSGSGSSSGQAATDGVSGSKGEERRGMLWSFLQHLVTMLVNKLQLRVSNVHISLQDAAGGTVAGLRLQELRTVPLSEAEHFSGEETIGGYAGGLGPGGRGVFHKQLAMRGLSAYWAPGAAGSGGSSLTVTDAARPASDFATSGAGQAPGLCAPTMAAASPQPEQLHPLLLPLDCTIQLATYVPGDGSERGAAAAAAGEFGEGQAAAAEGLRIYATAVVHSLDLSLHHDQAADMLRFADSMAWLAATNRCAVFRPECWQPAGSGSFAASPAAAGAPRGRRQLCWQLWQYAVNAVLAELQGQRHGVPWLDAPTRRRLRLEYIRAYTDHLVKVQALAQAPKPKAARGQQQRQQQHEAALLQGPAEANGVPGSFSRQPSGTALAADASVLAGMERQLPLADILLCRRAARDVAAARSAQMVKAPAQVTPAKRPRGASDLALPASSLCLQHPTAGTGSSALATEAAGTAAAAAGSGAGEENGWALPAAATARPSLERSRSGPGLGMVQDGVADGEKGYISWGLSKVAGFLGYMPHAEGSAELLEPTELDVQQLYEAVDFDPAREAPLKPAQRGVQVSVDCLVRRASLLLRHPPCRAAVATPAGSPTAASLAARALPALLPGAPIAAVELDHARLDVQLLPEAFSVGLVVSEVVGHDLVTNGQGVTETLLGRLEMATHQHHQQQQQYLPMLRMKLNLPLEVSRPPSPTPQGSPRPSFQQQSPPPAQKAPPPPTLDVLVQPLQLHYRPACLLQLQQVPPAMVRGGFHEHLLAAVNGLSAEARAAEKAGILQALGAPLDVLVKVLDVHLLLGNHDGSVTSPAAVLSTGPVTFHSVRQQPQLSVGAALDLLRHQCCEHAASYHQGAPHAAPRDAAALPEAAASAAAVMVVEQQLVYQHFEFRLDNIQLLAVNADLPGSGVGVDTGSVRGGRRPGGEAAGGGSHSGSNRRQILQPFKLGGALKLHRITDDTALTQVHCALQLEPITLSLTPVLVAHLSSLLLPGTPPSQPGTTPLATAVVPGSPTGTASAAQRSSAATSATACDAAAVALSPVTSVMSGEGKRRQRLPAVVLDVRLTSLDASYFVQGGRAGKVEAHAHLSLLRGAATLQIYPAGVEAQVSLSGISLRDLSPEVLSLLPVGGPIPHLAKAITLETLSVAFDGTADGGRSSTTEVHLQDLVAHGYAGEPGNFMTRLHERRPTVGTIVVQDTPDALHTTVSLSNLVLGHSLLLRILALIVRGDENGATADDMEVDEEAAGTPLAAAAAVSEGTPGPSPSSQSAVAAAAAAAATALPLDLGWDVAGPVSSVGNPEGSPQALPPPVQLDSASSPEASSSKPNGLVVNGHLESSPATASAAGAAAVPSIPEAEAAVAGPSIVAWEDLTTTQQLASTPLSASAEPPVAGDDAELAQAPPEPLGRRVVTSVQLNNCRVVCKYRRGHFPTVLGSTGTLSGKASFSATSAAAREALELHEDIVALDIPCLSLQLPLGPPPLDAAGREVQGEASLVDSCFAGEEEAGQAAVAAAGESEEAPFDPVPSVAGDSLTEASSLPSSFASPARPRSQVRRATSGQSLYTSASSSDLDAGSSSQRGQQQRRRQQQQQQGMAGLQDGGVLPPQPLLTASGLCLSLATVGLASRSMLPVLSIPSLELLCRHRVAEPRRSLAAAPAAVWMSEGLASRQANGSAAQLLAASGASKVSASPAEATYQAGSRSPHPELVACYSLAVGSVELGAHPSHVPMLGVLVDQVVQELMLLMRDAPDMTAAEGESVISSTSSPHGLPSPGTRGASRPSSAAGLGQQGPKPGPLWELDACIGLVAVSLLGSVSSSSCLRLEWEGLQCSASSTGSTIRSCTAAGLQSAGSKPLSGPADSAAACAASLRQLSEGEKQQEAPVLLAGQVSWRQVAVHVLRPNQRPSSSLDTPFAAAAHIFDASRAESGQALSDLVGPQAELLYHWSMGMEPSRHSMPTIPYQGSGARRSLSAGLAAMQEAGRQPSTEQEPSFFYAPSRLLARGSGSSGISRYFSAADDDEFEDAASDWAEGASSPGGGSPRQPALLPLSLASPDYHPMLLLRLVGCGGEEGLKSPSSPAEDASPAAVGGEDEGASEAPPQEVLLSFERSDVQQQPELAQCSGRRPSLDQHRSCLESQQEWAVLVGGVALQVHMQGWLDALACLQSYAAPGRQLVLLLQGLNGPAAGAAAGGPQKSPAAAAAAALTASAAIAAVASGSAATAPALGLGSPQQAQSQQQQGASGRPLGLRVQLQRLTVAAVADGPLQHAQRTQPGSLVESEAEGPEEESTDDIIVPALSLTTAVTISCCAEAGGGLLVGVDIPMALLGVGVVPRHAVPAVVMLPLHESLIGLRHAELSVVLHPPASLPGPLPMTIAAEAAQHSLPHTSVAANVEHVSAWGSQRNLSIVAAFAQHVQQLAQQLGPLAGPEGEGDKGQSVPAAGPGGLFTLKLNLQKLAVLLSLAQHYPAGSRSGSTTALAAVVPPALEPHQAHCHPVPLFELVASAVTMDLHDVGVGWLEASVASHLQLDVFSTSKQGWEPVLEPWQCRLVVVTPTSGSAHHRHLGISAQQGLEVTVTDTAAEAAGLLAEAFQPIPEVFDEPDMLTSVLRSADGAAAHLSAAWWLHNLTGAALEVWVVTPAQARAARHLTAPAMLTAPAGSKLALPVFAHGQAAQQQRHAGQPSASTGIAECRSARGSRSRSGRSSSASLNGMLQPSHRTLLFFRLAGQGTPSGPVHMDRLEPSLHVVQSAELGDLQLRAKVVCEMQEGRFGGSTILLHSGVQVHNTTEQAIDVGVQTPMGLVMEPQPLWAVLPGKSLWLPVLRAEAGLLCIRPSFVAAGHSPLIPLPAERPPHPATRVAGAGNAPTADAASIASWGVASLSLPGGVEAGSSTLAAPVPRRPAPLDLQQASSGSVPFPAPHPALLYASGRLSPARASLDRSALQQLDAAVAQHVQQAQHVEGSAGSMHSGQAVLGGVQGHQHDWSTAVALQQLLRQPGGDGGASTPGAAGIAAAAAATEGHRPLRQLVCHPALGSADELPMIFSLGAVPSDEDGLIWDVTISPPLTLHNALPVPLDITLRGAMKSYLLSLRPNQQIGLHQLEAAQVESLALKALGYQPTGPIVPTPIPSSVLLGQEAWATRSLGGTGTVTDMDPSSHEIHALETLVQLNEVGHGNASVQVAVRHSLNTMTGMHTLRLGCTLWVYNLTGAPISLRQSLDEIMVLRRDVEPEEDLVPAAWVPPLSLGLASPAHRASSALGGAASSSAGNTPPGPRLPSPLRQAQGLRSISREGIHSMRSVPNLLTPMTSLGPSSITPAPSAPPGTPSTDGRAPSILDMPGLGEILAGEEGMARQVPALKKVDSRARGIADSMEAAPVFEMPSRWPSMHGGLQLHRHRLKIQVRATQCKAPEGSTYWSDPVELDATVGGAAVVTAPAPLLPPASALPAPRAAYMMSVTAAQVPGSEGALALYLLPRYLLRNALDVPIQYKQQGTGFERELEAGTARPLRCADASRALRLCVRVQEAGWMWSGGFALDTPGDMFIKIRHRDRGVTMLVRVDVAASASGVLVVTLSHHPAGFAPYRIENCTTLTLHARQHRCKEQQDVLRPYCALNYAWDEPALPHKLVLELPGAKFLGIFQLDKVEQDVTVKVPAHPDEPERRVRVLVRAEGPTRVLSVLDVHRHCLVEELQRPPAAARGVAGTSRTQQQRRWPYQQYLNSLRGVGGGGGDKTAAAVGDAETGGSARAVPSGLLWEVSAELASVGVSFVSPSHELGYMRAGQLRSTVAMSAARFVVDLEVKTLQVDNPRHWVAHPVTLVLPAPASRLTSTMAAATLDKQRKKPALSLQLAVWQRRPAGVICIEHADLQVAPLGVFVEQQHALQLAAFLSSLSASFLPAAASGSSPSSGGMRASASGHLASLHTVHGLGAELGGMGGATLPPASRAASMYAGDLPSPGAAVLAGLGPEAGPLVMQLPRDLLALLSGQGQGGVAQGQKVYIDIMTAGPLDITVSFLPAPWDPQSGAAARFQTLQRLLSLADVEDAHLRLAGLELRHPLMGTDALAQVLQRHYMMALIPQLYKVVGAANVFGDPVRLVHHLGLGVWSFLASPAAGLVESARQRGPRQFVAGLVSGTQGLVANVVFAFSNAATKGSGAARKFIAVLGLDKYDRHWAEAQLRRQRVRFDDHLMPAPDALMLAGPRRGRLARRDDAGIFAAVMRGVVGVISEPIRGVDEGGLRGFAHGLKRGVLGFVVIPLASLLDMSARVAESIRRAVAGASSLAWVRPPRYVCPGELLSPYDWQEAMGRWLLAELDRQRLGDPAEAAAAQDAFVLCVPAAANGHYLVATTSKVLYIHAREPMWMPLVKWSARLVDLELATRDHSVLSMVALHAERTLFMLSMWDQLSDARARPRGPWSYLRVECENEEGAARFDGWVAAAMTAGQRRVTILGHAQVLSLG